MYRDLLRYLKAALVLTLLVLAALAVLHLLDIPRGDLVDWAVGVVSVWWLLLVTTVPWSVHFEASAALRDAEASAERGIRVDRARLAKVRTLGRRALAAALALHVLSAAGLYVVAAAGWSEVGYAAAVLALALTFVRPGARAYAHVAEQLQTFRREVHYPREDVVSLRKRVRDLEGLLDLRSESSWAAALQAKVGTVIAEHDGLAAEVGRLRSANAQEHARLEQEYRAALATVTEDRRFVEHLREIVRFVRSA